MHGNKFRAWLCLCTAMLLTGLVYAQPPAALPEPPGHNTANQAPAVNSAHLPAPQPEAQGARIADLARIQEEKLLAKARLDLLTMQGELKAVGAKNGQVAQTYAPTVKAVLGSGGRLYATFAYPGNMTMDAKVGDVITGGYTVESIGVDQVTLSRNGETLRLGFSASPPTPLPERQAGAFMPTFNPGVPGGMPQ